MLYRSTRDEREIVDFRTAVIKGLAENKGLYIPVQIPSLPASFFAEIDKKSNVEIATEVMHSFVEENITQEELLKKIKSEQHALIINTLDHYNS